MIVPTEKQAQHYGKKKCLEFTKLRAFGKWCAEFLLKVLGGQHTAHTYVALQYTA